MILQSDFWGKVSIIIEEKGMNIQDFCDSTGLARSTVNRWTSKNASPRLKTIKLIAEVLNTPLNYFIEENFNEQVKALQRDVEGLKHEINLLKQKNK